MPLALCGLGTAPMPVSTSSIEPLRKMCPRSTSQMLSAWFTALAQQRINAPKQV